MPVNNNNLPVQVYGATAEIATNQISGVHYQINKLAYGASGSATTVSTTTPLPVTVTGGITAYISPDGWVNVRGNSAGAAVSVQGNVGIYGITGNPVTVTGGRYLGYTYDSVKLYGPSGQTWMPATLVSASGAAVGVSGDQLKVYVEGISGLTVSVGTTMVCSAGNTALEVQGKSGGYPIGITCASGAYIGVTNPDIIAGITALYGQVVGLRADLAGAGAARPSTSYEVTTTLTSPTTATFSGFTCQVGINVKAHSTNSDSIWIGGVTGSSLIGVGMPLDPGQIWFIDINNTNKIAVTANSGTQKVSIMAT